jgi:hypothetical protein
MDIRHDIFFHTYSAFSINLSYKKVPNQEEASFRKRITAGDLD